MTPTQKDYPPDQEEKKSWYEGNKKDKKKLEENNEQLLNCMRFLELQPKKVLEIGCSGGWFLHEINKKYKAECFGIDIEPEGITEGSKKYPELSLKVGNSATLQYDEEGMFDTVIYGFCLYRCDRRDLFKIAYEGDKVLSDKGNIIIRDFYPPFPYKNPHKNEQDVFSYKMKYANMFSWNPCYTVIFECVFDYSGSLQLKHPDDMISITVLKKNLEYAYPNDPYSKWPLQKIL